jgi:hypothetical protein
MLVGQPKKREDLEPLTDGELGELDEIVKHIFASGQPVEIPAALPTGLIMRMAVTFGDYRKMMQDLITKHDDEEAEVGPAVEEMRAYLKAQGAPKLILPGRA